MLGRQNPSQVLFSELQANEARAEKAAKRKKKKRKRQAKLNQATNEAIQKPEALQKPTQSSGGAVAMCIRCTWLLTLPRVHTLIDLAQGVGKLLQQRRCVCLVSL